MPPVLISGFTFVRNAVKLDFPVVASIRSLLPVCDEVVVAVGKGEDETLDLVRSVGDPRVRIIETEWDLSRGRSVLADQTDLALRACRHPWGIYIQADEVLADGSAEQLREAIQAVDGDPRVEGLLVRYRHFYGGFDRVATHRRMYQREVRAVRTDPALGIHSFRDAQGFRVGPADRKIRARLTDGVIFHYGWARAPGALPTKQEEHSVIFQWDEKTRREREGRELLPWLPGLAPFEGPHPVSIRAWIAERATAAADGVAPFQWRWRWLRYWASMLVERATDWRPFEFRNYERV
ncbi:MAG: glycosyltransferase family 2 protein [Gemmatimonadota bacterium]